MLKAAVQTIILMSILVTGNVSCLSAEVRFCDYTNLGQRVGSICLHWINESTSDVDPIDTELIADGGVVDSIIVKYPKSITLQEVRESVNKTWLVYENKRLATNKLGDGWRSNEHCFAAILSKDEDDYVVLSVNKIHPAKTKQ